MRYRAIATQRTVFQVASSSKIKCVFIEPIRQCHGSILCMTVCPTYIIIAFIPDSTNGDPAHHCFTSIMKYKRLRTINAIEVVTKTNDRDLRNEKKN